jgi:hypothetical protein
MPKLPSKEIDNNVAELLQAVLIIVRRHTIYKKAKQQDKNKPEERLR